LAYEIEKHTPHLDNLPGITSSSINYPPLAGKLPSPGFCTSIPMELRSRKSYFKGKSPPLPLDFSFIKTGEELIAAMLT
jgi:hypothetical protein